VDNNPDSPKWEVGFTERTVYVVRRFENEYGEEKFRKVPRRLVYVVIHRADDSIPFLVTYRKGCVSFSDAREEKTGVAGTTGRWSTRTAQKAGPRRVLTATAWVVEVSRFIGTEGARQVVDSLRGRQVV
jgi:hypothetical protein